MISERLRRLIDPYLRMELSVEEYKYIDQMFAGAYISTYDGVDYVSLEPFEDEYISLQFSTLNGAYIQCDLWDEAKRRGRKA